MSLRLVGDLVASLALDKEEVTLLEAIFICRAGEAGSHLGLSSCLSPAPPVPGLASGQISATTALARHSHALWPSQPARQALFCQVLNSCSWHCLVLLQFLPILKVNLSFFNFCLLDTFSHLMQTFYITYRLVNLLLLLRHLAEVPASVMAIQVPAIHRQLIQLLHLSNYCPNFLMQVMQAPLERVTSMVERIAFGVL